MSISCLSAVVVWARDVMYGDQLVVAFYEVETQGVVIK